MARLVGFYLQYIKRYTDIIIITYKGINVIIIVWLNRSRIFKSGTGVPESHAFGTGVPESHAFSVSVPRILGQSPTHLGLESAKIGTGVPESTKLKILNPSNSLRFHKLIR